MGKSEREKGKRGERQLAAFLREHGYDARRGVQHSGGPDSPDVVGLPGLHIECKYVERLNFHDALEQSKRDAGSDEIPVVFSRRSDDKWKVTLYADDFINIYREWEAGRQQSSGLFECMHCGCRSVIWGGDFTFEDYGMDGEGIVHDCHCVNCGADVQYFVPIDTEEDAP